MQGERKGEGVDFNFPVSEIRPSVIRMARMMEIQLRANEHRGGWNNCDRVYFLEKLQINLQDLRNNLAAGTYESAQRDCADMANFAMMLAENEMHIEHAKTMRDNPYMGERR